MPSPEPPAARDRWSLFETAAGTAAIRWSEVGITGVALPARDRSAARAEALLRFADAVHDEPSTLARVAIERMTAALDGATLDLRSVPIDLGASSAFHRAVYEAAREVPSGQTSTYGALAERVGTPRASRAVGQAMRRNPIPLLVPCHRILARDGTLGGFSAGAGTRTKLTLLLAERDALLRAHSAAKGAFDPAAARSHLRSADPDFGALLDAVGPCTLAREPAPSSFDALARAVVYQQLTGRAAETIFLRVCAAVPFGHQGLDPARIVRVPASKLRDAGLSVGKYATLRALARASLDGVIPSLDEATAMSDDEIIARLTRVHGIGRWTAEMFLLFTLGRADILPLGDLGVRKGFARWTGDDRLPSLIARGARWAPYRSVATWYLWRFNDRA